MICYPAEKSPRFSYNPLDANDPTATSATPNKFDANGVNDQINYAGKNLHLNAPHRPISRIPKLRGSSIIIFRGGCSSLGYTVAIRSHEIRLTMKHILSALLVIVGHDRWCISFLRLTVRHILQSDYPAFSF